MLFIMSLAGAMTGASSSATITTGGFFWILRSALEIFSVRVHAYVLMSNHFHLIIETPKANLSKFMRQFNISYTGYYNRRHRRSGHLYQGRFKAVVVDKDSYLLELSRYVHLNPIRIKAKAQRPESERIREISQYEWS